MLVFKELSNQVGKVVHIYYKVIKTSIKGKEETVYGRAGLPDIDLKCRGKENEGYLKNYEKKSTPYQAGGMPVGKKMEFKKKNTMGDKLETKDAKEEKEDMKSLLMSISCDKKVREKLMDLYGV